MTKPNYESVDLVCSFCGKSRNEVRQLIARPAVFICDDCVCLSLNKISKESLNLRAASWSFEVVAKLLYPIGLLFNGRNKSS